MSSAEEFTQSANDAVDTHKLCYDTKITKTHSFRQVIFSNQKCWYIFFFYFLFNHFEHLHNSYKDKMLIFFLCLHKNRCCKYINEYPQHMFSYVGIHWNCITKMGGVIPKSTHKIRGMFEMNCLLSSSSISTWGTIKTNTYLYRAIQYLHNGV